MQSLDCDFNSEVVNKDEEIVSLKCELHENLQQAMGNGGEQHAAAGS